MKVVYLSYMPLTARIARDWYIDHLISKGVDVQFWDITEMMRGKVTDHYQLKTSYTRVILESSELKVAINERWDSVYVLILPKAWKFRSVFRLLTKRRCRTVCIAWGAMPTLINDSKAEILLLLHSPRLLLSKIRNRVLGSLINSSIYLHPYDVVFAAGEIMLDRRTSARKTVPIALCDYDHYTRTVEGDRIIQGKYAVFLDIYLPFQSDLALVGMEPLSAIKYYADLNRLFDLLECKYGIEIVIALHPKALYRNDEFAGRRMLSNCTPEVVRDAEFVIGHSSTSVSYAVLHRKPVLLTFTDDIERLYYANLMRQIQALSLSLGAPMVNASRINEVNLPALNPPDEFLYAVYKRKFLVTGGINGDESKQIFFDEITALQRLQKNL